ncbi:MAG: DUF4381 domain-containing protein [Halieaceae bacterium]
MNPQDPLAQLHPLREPELIGWWPLAPGWWFLLALLGIAMGALAYWLWRRYQKRAYRRQATRQLAELLAAYRDSGDTTVFVAETNKLLKATALVAFPRRGVAATSGEAWRQLLNDALPDAQGDSTFGPEFDEAAYRSGPPSIDPEGLHQRALAWIQHHKVPA